MGLTVHSDDEKDGRDRISAVAAVLRAFRDDPEPQGRDCGHASRTGRLHFRQSQAETVRENHAGPTLGICQWFHYLDDAGVDRALEHLTELGCARLRTGISWADYHRPSGKSWYRRQMTRLAEHGLDLLVSVWHTPPSISESGSCSGPPRNPSDFAAFVWEIIQEYGDYFESIEIWNEPNNRIKWNFRDYDPDWSKFSHLLAAGASEARRYGKRTVLGGIIPVDPDWLRLMETRGALGDIDVLAFHAFPGMWWHDHPNWDWREHWHGWKAKADLVDPFLHGREIWVTETGLATWDVHEKREARGVLQNERLIAASMAPVDRLYWYSLIDLAPNRACVELTEDGRDEPNEYHMGLVTHDGRRKPAFHEFQCLLRTKARLEADHSCLPEVLQR